MENQKICLSCNRTVEVGDKFCPYCGKAEFRDFTDPEQPSQTVDNLPSGSFPSPEGPGAPSSPADPIQPLGQEYTPYQNTPITSPSYPMPNAAEIPEVPKGNGNIIAGIVGAFLFSLIGGCLYFLVYQIGFIAGICGLIIFVLANFGYGLFAKTKNKESMVGFIASIIITVLTIFLSEYFCLSFEIFKALKDLEITVFDAMRITPKFISAPEIQEDFISDLVFAYLFGFLASIGNIINFVKAKKKNR